MKAGGKTVNYLTARRKFKLSVAERRANLPQRSPRKAHEFQISEGKKPL